MKIILIIIILVLAGCGNRNELAKKKQISAPAENRRIKESEITIAESTTPILDSGKNRLNNIKIACEKINGAEVVSGGVFSFNSATGKRSVENGYKNAPVIVDGEKSYGIGGGVCQVSTTIYLATLNTDLEIIEHYNHSEPVAYAPKGKDATVVYGRKDLKFRNNSDNSIYIYTWIDEGKVFAKIIKKSIDIQYN